MIIRLRAVSAAAGQTCTGRVFKAAAENILQRLAGNATALLRILELLLLVKLRWQSPLPVLPACEATEKAEAV
jgi:hypothetical protein